MGRYAASLRTHETDAALSASLELQDGRVKIAIGETPIGDWSLKDVEFEKIPSGYRVAVEGEHVLLDLAPNDALAIGVQLNNLTSNKKRRGRNRDKVESKPRKKPKGANATATELNSAPIPPARAPLAPERVPADPRRLTPSRDETSAKPKKAKRRKARSTSEAAGERRSFTDLLKKKTPYYLDRILDAVEPRLKPYLPGWVFNRLSVVLVLAAVVATPIFPSFMSTVLVVVGGLTVGLGAVTYTDSVMSSRLLYGRTTPVHVLVVGVVIFALGLIIAIVAN